MFFSTINISDPYDNNILIKFVQQDNRKREFLLNKKIMPLNEEQILDKTIPTWI